MAFDGDKLSGIGKQVVKTMKVRHDRDQIQRFSYRGAVFEQDTRNQVKRDAGPREFRFVGQDDVQAHKQTGIVDPIVAARRNTAAHPDTGPRSVRAQPDTLPYALYREEIIVAPDQDMPVRSAPGKTRATAVL